MTENVENLLLEHMKRFHASFERVERELRELKVGQAGLRSDMIGVRRDIVNAAEGNALLQMQLDAVKERLDRIERRLDLVS